MGLFSKDWQDSDEGKALAWVRRQSGDKRALAQAAMKAPSYNVKVAAVEQLESQELLKLVATSEEHTDSDVKSMAMRKISDQAFLADYASKGWAAAIESLTDEGVLAKILTDPFFFKLRGGDEAVIYHMNGERGRKIQRQDRERKEKLANEALKRLSKLKGGDAEALRAVAEKSGYKCARRYCETGRIETYINFIPD